MAIPINIEKLISGKVVENERIYKLPDRSEAQRIWNYPFRALEEAIVNSMYHRAWDVREPVVIRILPDSIEIITDRSVRIDEIRNGTIRNPRYRNRRIGDFLKELDMTEGRGTGIPIIRREMKKNGSPEPIFETGDDYSYFITQLPIHPAFLKTDETLNDVLNGKDDSFQVSDNKYYTFFNVKHETLNKTLNETLNETLKNDLAKILELIHKQAGITQSDIINEIEKSRTTIFRYLNILKSNDWIEYKGAKKTGGYHLTNKAKDRLKN